jgi:hypothetical protein
MELEILLMQALMLVLLVLFLVLVVRIFRGDFWPGRLLREFREGKRAAERDEDT